MTQEEQYDLHIKMLSKSFHRENDDLTSILLGDAVSIACNYIEEIEGYIKTVLDKIEELELFKSEHLRLEAELNAILHPNGDGPTAPSFCDLVAYVRNDITKVTPQNLCSDCSNSSFGNPYLESEQSQCHHCRNRYELNSFFNPSTKL